MKIKTIIKSIIIKYAKRWLPEILSDYYLPEGLHGEYYTNPFVHIDNIKLVNIGNGSFINSGTCLYVGRGNAHITIGENVFIGPNCIITTISHNIGSSKKRAGANVYADVVIDNGSWIGAHSTILPGVTISKGTVIASGSVITHDCLPNCLYAGVPAKKIREL